MKLIVKLIAVLALFAFASGCKSDTEKVCKHMGDLLVEKGATDIDEEMKKCPENMESRVLSQCSNRDEVVDCYLQLTDMSEERKCMKLCKKE